MWLPFCLGCKLRVLSIIHKSIYSFTPSYISDLIKKYTILPSLHYQNAPLLISQDSSKTSLNSRAFKNAGPTLCNSLPHNFRSIISHKIFINLNSSFLITFLVPNKTYIIIIIIVGYYTQIYNYSDNHLIHTTL